MEEKLKKVLADLFKLDIKDINDETNMKNVRAWDSLKHMLLVNNIEKGFEIERLSMDQIIRMVSIKDIKEILREKKIEI
jgi:acyl carrier protein